MKFFFSVLAILIAVSYADEVAEEDNVAILTDKNFDGFVSENTYVLVEFCK